MHTHNAALHSHGCVTSRSTFFYHVPVCCASTKVHQIFGNVQFVLGFVVKIAGTVAMTMLLQIKRARGHGYIIRATFCLYRIMVTELHFFKMSAIGVPYTVGEQSRCVSTTSNSAAL
jgi:hypothetical protein